MRRQAFSSFDNSILKYKIILQLFKIPSDQYNNHADYASRSFVNLTTS